MRVLLDDPSSRRGVNERDICDMTPLHIAASRSKGAACARLLLERGAKPDAPGPFGVPPRLCAHSYGYHATDTLLRQHGAPLTRGPLPELSFRSTLAHLFGIGGTTQIDGHCVSLEKAYPEATFGLLGDAVAACAQDLQDPTRAAALQRAAAALQKAGNNIGAASAELHARIQAGEAVVVPCGLPCHCTACVYSRGRAMWCDRLLRPSVVEIGFDTRLARLRRLQRSGVAWHGRAVARMVAAMRLRADVTPRRALGAASPKPQHVGNCAMASAKAALWALLMLEAPSVTGAPQAGPAWAAHLYKTATTYARSFYLKAYLSQHAQSSDVPQDAALVEACQAKLRKRRAFSGLSQQGDKVSTHAKAPVPVPRRLR